MITRKQIIPMLLKAYPSFGQIWGPIQRPGEEEVIYVAFGAFAAHFNDLSRDNEKSELRTFRDVIKQFQEEGDADVHQLATDLEETVHSQIKDDRAQ